MLWSEFRKIKARTTADCLLVFGGIIAWRLESEGDTGKAYTGYLFFFFGSLFCCIFTLRDLFKEWAICPKVYDGIVLIFTDILGNKRTLSIFRN